MHHPPCTLPRDPACLKAGIDPPLADKPHFACPCLAAPNERLEADISLGSAMLCSSAFLFEPVALPRCVGQAGAAQLHLHFHQYTSLSICTYCGLGTT